LGVQAVNVKRVTICIMIGVLVTPVAALLAISSAGAGHGHYVWAKLFFPFTLLMPHFFPGQDSSVSKFDHYAMDYFSVRSVSPLWRSRWSCDAS
jgi:hypothetical protein